MTASHPDRCNRLKSVTDCLAATDRQPLGAQFARRDDCVAEFGIHLEDDMMVLDLLDLEDYASMSLIVS
ncbi:hypothetical protein [Halopiger aswanensis]|uniref:hypothetical protein n=1 Tax=Halopiger aswanensis TaxID=148449 RepID=UPI001475D3ED|nr:hypothetical protein [Halopiger aswanensis]